MIWNDIVMGNNFGAKQLIIKTNTPKPYNKIYIQIFIAHQSPDSFNINLRDVFICTQMQQTENLWKRSISIPSKSSNIINTTQ